jgi:hypothetical protein
MLTYRIVDYGRNGSSSVGFEIEKAVLGCDGFRPRHSSTLLVNSKRSAYENDVTTEMLVLLGYYLT